MDLGYALAAEFRTDTRYAYAVGRIRALELKLLETADFSRLLAAPDETVLRTELENTPYKPYLDSISDLMDFEQALGAALRGVYALAEEIDPAPQYVNILRQRYDWRNLKACFKARAAGRDPAPALEDLGLIPAAEMREIVAAEDFQRLPGPLAGPAADLAGRIDAGDSRDIDLCLEREQYRALARQAQKVNCPYLSGYFRRRIDLINIRSWLRCKQQNKDRGFWRKVALEGGLISPSWWRAHYEDEAGALAQALLPTAYTSLVRQSLSLDGLERRMQNFLFEYRRLAQNVVFGPEPVLAYIMARENEVGLLRIILVGKLNRLPETRIREQLYLPYV